MARGESAAQAPSADTRVESALRSAGLPFTMDGGDFRLNLRITDDRTQLVWVASKTAQIETLEFRDVWAVASRGKGKLPPDLATRLLTENVRMVLGAWQVSQGPDEYLVVFLAPVAASADAATLRQVIDAVAVSADRMEKELNGKDQF